MGSMIYKTNALYSIESMPLTPFKHENGRINNNELLLTEIKASLATHRTKPGYDTKTWRKFPKETQATERLCKGAPPGVPIVILVSDFRPKTYKINFETI